MYPGHCIQLMWTILKTLLKIIRKRYNGLWFINLVKSALETSIIQALEEQYSSASVAC